MPAPTSTPHAFVLLYALDKAPGETTDRRFAACSHVRVYGWRAACQCGARGLVGEVLIRADSPQSIDPSAGQLDQLRRHWRSHVGLSGLPLDVLDAADDLAHAEQRMIEAVIVARHQGSTWQQIADAAGITRQTAHQKWSQRIPPRR